MEKNSFDNEITVLEEKVKSLTTLCTKLSEENKSLRISQQSLNSERAALLEKNNQAKSRVEAMIRRLKTMEKG
ncbi:MAG: TIGR02449 family protein [Gammaproteobacteria bacterium]|nr:MAG: TIGR02449 family protein [Gammaproteobacteria bacterium]